MSSKDIDRKGVRLTLESDVPASISIQAGRSQDRMNTADMLRLLEAALRLAFILVPIFWGGGSS